MTSYDVSSTASSVIGIAGMGIGLGMLAGTSRAVMDTMYGDRWKPHRATRSSVRKPRTSQPYNRRREYQQTRYKRPQYGYWRD